MEPSTAIVLITIYAANIITAQPRSDMQTCMHEAKQITETKGQKFTASWPYPYEMNGRKYSAIRQETRQAFAAYCVPGYVTGE